MKICPRCKLNKKFDDYRASRYQKGGGWCRVCCKEYEDLNKERKSNYNKRYAITNKDKIIQRKKSNKEKINLKQRERRAKNREMYNERYLPTILAYKKNRRKNDEQFRLREILSSMIYQALKKQNSSKNNISIFTFLSYSLLQLKEHLEKQFEPWMNWSNWGKYDSKKWDDNDLSTWTWNIDHIIPQSKLPYVSMEDDSFKRCWSLDNLRPYSAKQNIAENNRRNKW